MLYPGGKRHGAFYGFWHGTYGYERMIIGYEMPLLWF